ncbi:MAG: DAK2 domain-containing protein [Actinobacteria bacterium]|nr:DAK2 domain-containing protein [Actinomycetota bacterium]
MQVVGTGPQVLDGTILHAWAVAATQALARVAPRIDSLNVFPVADGDTGTNTSLTFAAGLAALETSRPVSGAEAADVLARGALAAARGSSGVILGAWLTGLAAGLAPAAGQAGAATQPGAHELVGALRTAALAARTAVERPSGGTVLDVAAQVADEACGTGLDHVLPAAVAAARRGLRATSERHPVLRAAGVVDAGACALLVVLEALAAVLAGGPVQAVGDWVPGGPPRAHEEPVGGAFEVMAQLGVAADAAAVRSQLASLGDAVAVVGDRDGWRTHVHTDGPGTVLDLLGGHRLAHAVVRAVHGPHHPAAVVVTQDVQQAVWFAAAGTAAVVPGPTVGDGFADVVHEVAGPDAAVLATDPGLQLTVRALTGDPLAAAVAAAAASGGALLSGAGVPAALARVRRVAVADDAGLPAALADLLDGGVEVLTAVPAAGADPGALRRLVVGHDIDVVVLPPTGSGAGWVLGAE